jgi:hypothetical protein
MRRLTRTTGLPLAVAGMFALTACGNGGTTDTAPATPDTQESPDTGTDTDTDMDTDTGTDTDMRAGDECVEGEWDADLEAAERRVVDSFALGDLQIEPEVDVTGETIVTFEGDEMTTEFNDQVTTLTLVLEDDEEISAEATLNGSTTATYMIEGDTLRIMDVDVSQLDSEVVAMLGDEEYDLPGVEALGADAQAVEAEFTYTCSDDELRLTPVVDEEVAENLEGDTGTDTGTGTDTDTGTGTDTGTDTDTDTEMDTDTDTDTGTGTTDGTTEVQAFEQVLTRR